MKTLLGFLTVRHSAHITWLALLGCILVFLLVPAARGASTFAGTGSLATARGFHTATLLPSGKVLVAGGVDSSSAPLASAELYDPATGTWAATGSLATARYFHTATLLSNGKVLVAGGAGGNNNTAIAELYDPTTGTWASTGTLATARSQHTATLLPNGKVLVVGGWSPGGYLASAQLYDPATGIWSPTGSLATARDWHTATLLANGKVLVAGGETSGSAILASAEVYDPTPGTWSATGALATARRYFTATALANGKVLAVGGQTSGASTELYDASTGIWSATGSLASPLFGHAATRLDNGTVLVAGGVGEADYETRAQVYDPVTGLWRATGLLSTAHAYFTATQLPGGKVLYAGGYNSGSGGSYLGGAELFNFGTGMDPITDTSAPVVQNLSASPTPVDISSDPQYVSIRVRITDSAGFYSGRLHVLSPWVMANQAFNNWIDIRDSNRISGNAQDGIYSATLYVPYAVEAIGTWMVDVVALSDIFYNTATEPSGHSISFEVTGDFTAPQIPSWSVTPGTVEVNGAPGPFTMDIRVTDAELGLSSGSVNWQSPDWQQSEGATFDASNRISGTAQDGIYRLTLTIPQDTAAGIWMLTNVTATDGRNAISLQDWQFPPDSAATILVTNTPPAPELKVEQPAGRGLTNGGSPVSFGTVTVGDSAPKKTFTIRNTGPGPLSGLLLTFDGPQAADFSAEQPAATTLAPGQSTTFTVQFTARAADARNAIIRLASNAPGAQDPFDIALTGTGRAASVPPQLVKDMFTGAAPNGSSNPYLFTAVEGTVFFVASDGVHGYELWKSDGTEAGTVMVKDILAGSASSAPAQLVAIGGRLFFTVQNSSSGTDLWTSNGTEAGTVRLMEGSSAAPTNLTAMGSSLYFTRSYQTQEAPLWGGNPVTTATAELWKSDGTTQGTVLLTIDQSIPDPWSFSPAMPNVSFNNLTPNGNILYFTGFKSAGSFNHESLWKSDGTPGGTLPFPQTWESMAGFGFSMPTLGSLAVMAGTLYFQAAGTPDSYGAVTYALWQCDGASAGPSIVKENICGFLGGGKMVPLGNHLYFAGSDQGYGLALWRSDGTAAGTAPVSGGSISNPYNLTQVGNKLLFASNDGINGQELWVSNGTDAGTQMVEDIRSGPEGSYPGSFTAMGDALYFVADDGSHGPELWKSNGTAAGTLRLADIAAGAPAFSAFGETLAVGTKLFFAATTPDFGSELYVYETSQAALDIAVTNPEGTSLIDGTSGFNFGSRIAGNPSNAATFTITNPGTANLNLGAITTDGTHPGDFSVDASGMLASVVPGGSTTFTVVFTPGSGGSRSAAIHITSNVSGEKNPFDIALSGSGSNSLAPTFNNGSDIGLTSNGFTATGLTLGTVTLGFSPSLGQGLTLVNNTGAGAVSGTFAGLPEGGGVAETFGGNTEFFTISYTGGSGNDITLTRVAGPGQATAYAWANFAGMPGADGSVDGTGTAARFSNPNGVAVDASGNIYVADATNNTIRKITSTGVVTTLAGTAGLSGNSNGTGSAARFSNPTGVTVDGNGNVYVADQNNHTIRMVTPAGVVVTLAGSAGIAGNADGSGSLAGFDHPAGVAVDTHGNVYVADRNNHTLRKVTPGGVVGTLAGSPGSYGSADGNGSNARFYNPNGVAVDVAGHVFVADSSNSTIRKVTPSGVVSTLAGYIGNSGSFDGTGGSARFDLPRGVAVDATGNTYVADYANHTIRKVTPAGVVTTVGGSPGVIGEASGVGAAAGFRSPSGIAVASTGILFVADSGNNCISRGTPGLFPITTLTAMSGLSSSAATLNGSVNPNGLITTAQFEYGPTPDYGTIASVTLSPNNDTSAHLVSAALTGLTANTTYYYRLTATNADGTSSSTGAFTPIGLPDIALEQPTGTGLTDGSDTIPFGAAITGNASDVKTFTITNPGISNLNLGAITRNGSNPGDFTVDTRGMLATVTPGGSTTFAVWFSPTASGPRSAALHIASNVGGEKNPFDIALSGTGVSLDLSNLTLSAGSLSPAFDAGTPAYTTAVTNSIDHLSLSPTLVDDNSMVSVNDVPVASGSASGAITLSVGSNPITILVTGQGGIGTKTYTVVVTRAPSSNAELSMLVIGGGVVGMSPVQLMPGFDGGITDYTALMPYNTMSIGVQAMTADASARLTVTGAMSFSNTNSSFNGTVPFTDGNRAFITFHVTAEDGSFMDYSASLTRERVLGVELTNLALSAGTLSPVFESLTASYSASVPYATSFISLTPTVTESGSTVKINNTSVESASQSGPIALIVGNNEITTVVTTQDGSMSKTYTTNVVRLPQPPPVITSATAATGVFGVVFEGYTITASNTPTSYGASGLPTGLIIDATRGVISGTPTQGGTFNVTLAATNTESTGNATLTLVVYVPATIVTAPQSVSALAGSSVTLSVEADGAAPLTYVWKKDGQVIAGISGSSLTLGTLQPSQAGSYRVVVSNTYGSATSAAAVVTVNIPPSATMVPVAGAILQGQSTTLTVTTFGSPSLSYHWYLGSVGDVSQPVGSNAASYSTGALLTSTNFWVRVANAFGTADAGTYAIVVNPPAPVITSPLVTSVVGGQSFSYLIGASNQPTAFAATPLPTGLTINTATGSITGIAVTPDGYDINLSATNITGTGTAVLHLTVNPPAPIITSNLVTTGKVGTAFTYQILATNSPASYSALGLPGGLAVNAESGAITGTPSASGSGSFTVSATNAGGMGSANVSYVIDPDNPPVITTAPSAAGRQGILFGFSVRATNSPVSYAAENLPGGLSINTNNGDITGTPIAAGTFTSQVTANNTAGTSAVQHLVITIAPPLNVPVLTSLVAATGRQGEAFSFQLVGSNPPNSFIALGLPTGVTLDAGSGLISGTPSVNGTFSVAVTARNGNGTSLVQNLTLTIARPSSVPVISNDSRVNVRIGQYLQLDLTASNSPTVYHATGLPTGLSLNASTGSITGTPTLLGSITASVWAENAAGFGPAQDIIFDLEASPAAPVILLPNPEVEAYLGQSFSYTITAINSSQSFAAGNLPPGLTLGTVSGVIAGTPTVVGSSDVSLTATNAAGDSVPAILTIVVNSPPSAPEISNTSLPRGRTGTAYSASLSATQPPILCYSATGLPAGLALDTTSGQISGTSSVSGTFIVDLSATNSKGQGSVKSFTLTIDPASAAPVITSPATFYVTQAAATTYQITALNSPTSFTATELPSGLILDPLTGAISGAAVEPGAYAVEVTATNASGASAPLSLVITVKALATVPRITTADCVYARADQAFSLVLEATELPASRPLPPGDAFVVSGLPSGYSYNSATGVVSGPASSNYFTFFASARNEVGIGPVKGIGVYPQSAGSDFPVIYGPTSLTGVQNEPLSVTILANRSLDYTQLHGYDSVQMHSSYATNTGPTLSYTPTFTGRGSYSLTGGVFAGWQYDYNYYRDNNGNYHYYVSGSYATYNYSSRSNLPITVLAGENAPTLTIPSSASARQGHAFSLELKSSDTDCRVEPLTSTPSWPDGLTLALLNGSYYLSGTPTVPGNYKISLVAVQKSGRYLWSMPTDLLLSVQAATSPATPVSQAFQGNSSLIPMNSLPQSFGSTLLSDAATRVNGTVGMNLDYTITAVGAPTRFEVGELPQGLAVNGNTGQVTGQPSVPGTYLVTVIPYVRQDAGMPFGLRFVIAAADGSPVVDSPATAAGQVGVDFSYQISASNFPESYGVASLPEFLLFDSRTGLLSGTPTRPGIFSMQLSASHAGGQGDSSPLMLTIAAADGTPVITSAASSTTPAGQGFTFTLTANPAATSFGCTELPLGLSLANDTGIISGTPTEPGIYSPEVWATNNKGEGDHVTFTLTVTTAADVPVITGPIAPRVLVNELFTVQLIATHAPVSFNAPALPDWVASFDPYTGILTGTVPDVGVYPLVFSANNASGTGPDFTLDLTGALVLSNAPPVASGATYTRAAGTSLKINIAALLAASTSDPDGDVRTLVSVGSSGQGATVSIASGRILYSPANNNDDSFSYTISDGHGNTATETIRVMVVNPAGESVGIVLNALHQPTMRFAGIPGYRYTIQRATASLNDWTDIQTFNAPVTGVFSFTDPTDPPLPSAFYRMRYNP